VRVSPTLVKSVVSSPNVGNTNSKSDIASHRLPIVEALTFMDPDQPEPLMKVPIYIEQDTVQFRTSVLIDPTTTLNFVSHDFLTRNDLLGKCTRGLKIVVRIANE